ncbi:MAG: class C sortase [Actinomycetaceae bacterium]|nr:class C sortase [Actinomycetaceae bacterium]
MKDKLLPLITALLVLAGVSMLTYPYAASWFSQKNQSAITANYSKTVKYVRPDAKTQIQAAHTYNQALTSGAQLKPNTRIPVGTGTLHHNDTATAADDSVDGLTYDQILRVDSTGLMARLRIPSIDVDLPVYHGTDDATLLKGVGHLFGTSMPVGGKGTRTVLTAHRGLADAALFTYLDKVKVGDVFTIEVFDQLLTYKVIDTVVVEPEDTETIRSDPDRDLATLVTCTPLGINTHRILVTGERVFPNPKSLEKTKGAAPEVPRFPWWAVVWIPAVLGCLGYIGYLFLFPLVKRTKQDDDAEEESSIKTSP